MKLKWEEKQNQRTKGDVITKGEVGIHPAKSRVERAVPVMDEVESSVYHLPTTKTMDPVMI